MLFIVHAWQLDEPQAIHCVSSLRQFYPDVKLLAIADGEDLTGQLREHCAAVGAMYHAGKRLKIWLDRQRSSVRWLVRLFELAVQHTEPGETVVCFDADCEMRRPFQHWPNDLLFGQPIISDRRLPGHLIQGSCYGFRREFADRVLASQLLTAPDSRYRSATFTTNKFRIHPKVYPNTPDELRTARICCDDRTLSTVALELQVPIGDWSSELGLLTLYMHQGWDWDPYWEGKAVVHPVL